MKKICLFILALLAITPKTFSQKSNKDLFPDGTKIPAWFLDAKKINPADLGKFYSVTDYGAVNDSTKVQTAAIQNTIDEAYRNGGGVVVIPKGTFILPVFCTLRKFTKIP